MKVLCKAARAFPALILLASVIAPRAVAQSPDPKTPIVAHPVVDTAAAIVVKAVKPKQPAGTAKFEGFVLHANNAQITARAKSNELEIQTFPLSEAASAKMQRIVDRGGYQYGDKVTIYYDPTTRRAVKVTGKPSRPI